MNTHTVTRKLVVFDMDGVIIDVSGSYRETARQCARVFFEGARSWRKLPEPLFTLEELAHVKQSGGLNNDWDLTATVISLLFHKVDGAHDPIRPVSWNAYRNAMERCDVSDLLHFLTNERRPLTRLMEKYGRRPHAFVKQVYTNDVGSGNIIKQLFQEIYLGKQLFEATYHQRAEAYQGDGLIHRERLLLDPAVLERISANHILAIATGRPASEADFALNHFNIGKYFSVVYTLDDCLKEENRIYREEKRKVNLSKPDPFMLDAISGSLAVPVSARYYIGDMPDDMKAAAHAVSGFKGVGLLIASPDKDRLRDDLTRAGANQVVEDFKGLEEVLATDLPAASEIG